MSLSPEFLALQSALKGRYLLERELGGGGMGVVFLAREIALERPVAIKLLPPHLSGAPELRERFLREARTAARLAHPNIVPIYVVEVERELAWFAMAFVPGQTLAERVREEGPLSPTTVARMVQEVAWALAYAHQHGVVHRDIKPENILIERGTGRALVVDFGIARVMEATPVTPHDDLIGTARYTSPEQAAGEPTDGRSDRTGCGSAGVRRGARRYHHPRGSHWRAGGGAPGGQTGGRGAGGRPGERLSRRFRRFTAAADSAVSWQPQIPEIHSSRRFRRFTAAADSGDSQQPQIPEIHSSRRFRRFTAAADSADFADDTTSTTVDSSLGVRLVEV